MHFSTTDEFRRRVFECSPLPIVVMDAQTLQYLDCNPAAVAAYACPSKEAAIGKGPMDFSAPIQYDGSPSREKAAFYVEQALQTGSSVFEWLHQLPSGETWDAEVHLLSFSHHERQLLQFSLLNITDRKRAEQLQRLQHDLILELNSCSDLDQGLGLVLEAVLKLDCIDCGGVYLVEPSGGSLHLVAHHGISAEFAAHVSQVAADAPTVRMAARGEVLYGTYEELRAHDHLVRGQEGLRGFAVIPIMSRGSLMALLNLSSRKSDVIPVRTRSVLETMAFQVGTILLRLRTEAALRETEATFQQFLDKSPVYVFFKDHELKAIRLSSNYEQMLGRPVSEILGRRTPELFPPDLAASIDAVDRAIIEGEKTVTVDEDLNGRHYTTIKFPIHIAGKPRYLAGYTIDITERKKTEESLRERTAQFQAFMDNMPAMAIIKDENLRPLFFNRAMFDNFPAKDWLGKTPHETFPPEVACAMVEVDRKAIKEGTAVYEEQWTDKNGERRVLETRKFAIQRGNLPAHLGAIISDITERRRNETLLQNAQKLEALGVLAGGIAHDFNNLLSGIFGYLDLARLEETEEERRECLEHALSVMGRARDLTRQLLTFAKGGVPVKTLDSLRPFLKDTVQFALSGASVNSYINIPDELWPCDYDKNQIAQVIDNLVINAIQAMPGGGTLEVSAQNVSVAAKQHAVLSAGSYVKICITDHGIGIPGEYLSRIFDPFFTTKTKGQGLGLATCYSIVNRHGGCIEVDSEPGKGSTFRVLLPAVVDAQVETSRSRSTRHRGQGTFLVMDDEEVVREMVGRLLEAFGYQVVRVKDGREALEFFAEAQKSGQPIAAMLFDLTVPGAMGGKEAIAELRKLSTTVPVFVASGYADDPVMAVPQEYGFNGSIPKPFTSRELSELLNAHLKFE
jgi:PAS domain S-box-containing protein